MLKMGEKVYWIGRDGLVKSGYLKGFVVLEKLHGCHAIVKMSNNKKVFLNTNILSNKMPGSKKEMFPTFNLLLSFIRKLFSHKRNLSG